MFTREAVEDIIEDCRLRANLFAKEHEGRARGGSVRVCIAGVDGGGLSTYGKSAVIGPDDHYECHPDYLYIYRKAKEYNHRDRCKILQESVTFVPYESIVAIECASAAAIG